MKGYTLAELAAAVEAELRGPSQQRITGLGTLLSAGPQQLTFLANPKYRSHLASTQAGAVLCRAEDAEHAQVPVLVVKDPYFAFATLSQWFSTTPNAPEGIHRSEERRVGRERKSK